MKRQKLLLLGSQMETGGAQRVLLDQADWFVSQGWQVTVVFLYDKEGLHQPWQKQASFEIINLQAKIHNAGTLANLLALMTGMGRLLHLMQTRRFESIETFTHHSNLIGLPLAWLSGIPRRIGSHHGHILGFPKRMEKMHAWIVNHFATRLVAVSHRVYSRALEEGIRSEKLTIINNGVKLPSPDPEAIKQIRTAMGLNKERLVLTAGRMTYQKAHTFLLQAAAQVLTKHPDTVFALAGDGPLRTELEREAKLLGIINDVMFLGIRSDLSQCMAAADVFVLSSRWEGLPMVLLEAMGMGTPVIATRVEGVEEVIQDHLNGLLVEVENADALADALNHLLSNKNIRRQMGEAARTTIDTGYTVDTMCRQYSILLTSN